jgi:hypothetical protein
MKLSTILSRTTTRNAFLSLFKSYLEDLDEPLLSSDNHIIKVFLLQGFFSGVKYRIYYEDKKGFTHEERNFG